MISNAMPSIVETKSGLPTNKNSNIVGHNGPMQCNLAGEFGFWGIRQANVKRTVMYSAERMH